MKSTTAWQNQIVGHADVAPDEVLARELAARATNGRIPKETP